MERTYTVSDFLRLKKATTRKRYHSALSNFMRFLNLNEQEFYEYIINPQSHVASDVSSYIESRDVDHANNPITTTKTYVSVIRQYCECNEVKFNKQEKGVFRVTTEGAETRELHFTTQQLQKLDDAADLKGRCLLTLLVSTGARINQLLQVKIEDVDFTKRPVEINFRRETIKGKRKGYTGYLTDEAAQILQLWLKEERENYMLGSQDRNKALVQVGIGKKRPDPTTDRRILPFHYETARSVFTTLLKKTVPIKSHKRQEWDQYFDDHTHRGRYRIHDFRKYLRTHASETMGVDAAEQLLNHTGYLQGAYNKRDPAELAKIFLAGQDALTIFPQVMKTREIVGEIDQLKRKNEELEKKLNEVTTMTESIFLLGKSGEKIKGGSSTYVMMDTPSKKQISGRSTRKSESIKN